MKTRPLPCWEHLARAPFEMAAEVLASAGVWEDLGAPRKFLEPFAKQSAWLARKKAMLGLVGARNLREQFIMDAVETLREIGDSKEKHWRMHADSCRRVLACFMSTATPDDLRKLAKAMERGSDIKKGGPESPEGEVWLAFVLWALNHRGLPSYEQLRDTTGFEKGSNPLEKHFADYVRNLGLEGLRHSP